MQLCIIAGSGNLPLQLAKENKDAFVVGSDQTAEFRNIQIKKTNN